MNLLDERALRAKYGDEAADNIREAAALVRDTVKLGIAQRNEAVSILCPAENARFSAAITGTAEALCELIVAANNGDRERAARVVSFTAASMMVGLDGITERLRKNGVIR